MKQLKKAILKSIEYTFNLLMVISIIYVVLIFIAKIIKTIIS